MSIRIRVESDAKLDLADELLDDFHEVAKETAEQAANMVLREVQRLLRQRRGFPETAAPPGEPPEYDLGDLEQSYRVIRPTVRGAVVRSGIRSDDPAAPRVEFGVVDVRGIRTHPHPHVRPAFDTVEPAIDALFQERFGG